MSFSLKTGQNISHENQIPVLVFFGPTASGKTSIAMQLFSYKNSCDFSGDGLYSMLSGKAEIISADSVQVYKNLKIGSASPSDEVLKDLPHHLIAIKDPKEEFSVADFVEQADILCNDIFSRNKLPILLGGTAFFLKNFMYGLPVTPKANPSIRLELQQRVKKDGIFPLFAELKLVDPKSAARLHPNDEYRVIRAMEIYYTSGKTLSSFALSSEYRHQYDFFVLSIDRPREVMYKRIEQRVDEMISDGLREEVEQLVACGYSIESPALNAIGYREFFTENNELRSKTELPQIVALIKKNTKHYAKRQETFFKALENVHHYNIEKDEEIKRLYFEIIDFYKSYFIY